MIIFVKVNKTFAGGSVVFHTRAVDTLRLNPCIFGSSGIQTLLNSSHHCSTWKVRAAVKMLGLQKVRFHSVPFSSIRRGRGLKCLSLTFGDICVVTCNMEFLRLDVGSRKNIFGFVFSGSNLIFFV